MLKWFGETWGAPVNETTRHTETPVGALCERCKEAIAEHDQGYVMPKLQADGTPGEAVFHTECLLDTIGVPVISRSIARRLDFLSRKVE